MGDRGTGGLGDWGTGGGGGGGGRGEVHLPITASFMATSSLDIFGIIIPAWQD